MTEEERMTAALESIAESLAKMTELLDRIAAVLESSPALHAQVNSDGRDYFINPVLR